MITSGRYEFKEQDDNIVFTGKYMEVYIDKYYEEKKCAEKIGDHFKTLGILNFRTFQDIDGKKPNKLKAFNLPIEIITYPSGGFEEKELDLIGKGNTRKYYVLKYYNGDVLCKSVIAASTPTFTLCMNIFLSGKLPPTIPYDSVLELWENSFRMNAVNFDIPDVVKEMIIAQVYRDPKNYTNTFGSVLAKNPKTDMYAYSQSSQREISSSQSTFNGLIFEDWDRMVISGINGTNEGRKENVSPMEEIMKY
jgi:hypothetical protein